MGRLQVDPGSGTDMSYTGGSGIWYQTGHLWVDPGSGTDGSSTGGSTPDLSHFVVNNAGRPTSALH
jgi:hypothetical protein